MALRRQKGVTALLVGPAAAFFLLLLVLPLVVVVIYSFGERGPAGGYTPAFTFDNYLNIASRGQAFLNTLMMAPLGTLLCALVAYPMAYYLAVKAPARWRVMLLVLIIVPFWASQLLRIYAWLLILGNRGIPSLLELVGLEDVRLVNTRFAVLLGMVYGYLPLMIFPIYVSLEKLDKRLLEASADLGAGAWRTFRQVTLPLSLPGVATGSLLVFILLMGEFIIPALLGGGKVFFIGNALVDLFLQSRNWPFGAAVAVSIVAIMLATIAVYMRFLLGRNQLRQEALI
ncbi:MAG: ABC transporter permease [Alphaproteobacteria bacterium]|jgi:spermidine/putrescine transport system permease protein|nr:ABC transporter permease [Alphaproteobacteria bacterium]MBU0804247.1 ABC transporter permease [Alphaproteobacteria bacterium]MBU0871078.1 ABC transporter permease [Alphaproteobacteria bacterium]MBU1400833.1 ABC transporter permease [Alphaproteobacteria bacterium]MBU1592750.1 ABC transporter permease [Alphaproteobacteria bacterium]